MKDSKIRKEIYAILDQVDIFNLECIVEDVAQEYGINSDSLFSCSRCGEIYGDCGTGEHTEICRERFLNYHQIK